MGIHGGLARVSEYPGAKTRSQEKKHEGDRRDGKISICAPPSLRPFHLAVGFHRSRVSFDQFWLRPWGIKSPRASDVGTGPGAPSIRGFRRRLPYLCAGFEKVP